MLTAFQSDKYTDNLSFFMVVRAGTDQEETENSDLKKNADN